MFIFKFYNPVDMLDLNHGIEYVVIVRATDVVGLNVETLSNKFLIDNTNPVAGTILTSGPFFNKTALIAAR